eukprot:scaffold654_cov207-Ochromonas_danica.AAC.42
MKGVELARKKYIEAHETQDIHQQIHLFHEAAQLFCDAADRISRHDSITARGLLCFANISSSSANNLTFLHQQSSDYPTSSSTTTTKSTTSRNHDEDSYSYDETVTKLSERLILRAHLANQHCSVKTEEFFVPQSDLQEDAEDIKRALHAKGVLTQSSTADPSSTKLCSSSSFSSNGPQGIDHSNSLMDFSVIGQSTIAAAERSQINHFNNNNNNHAASQFKLLNFIPVWNEKIVDGSPSANKTPSSSATEKEAVAPASSSDAVRILNEEYDRIRAMITSENKILKAKLSSKDDQVKALERRKEELERTINGVVHKYDQKSKLLKKCEQMLSALANQAPRNADLDALLHALATSGSHDKMHGERKQPSPSSVSAAVNGTTASQRGALVAGTSTTAGGCTAAPTSSRSQNRLCNSNVPKHHSSATLEALQKNVCTMR